MQEIHEVPAAIPSAARNLLSDEPSQGRYRLGLRRSADRVPAPRTHPSFRETLLKGRKAAPRVGRRPTTTPGPESLARERGLPLAQPVPRRLAATIQERDASVPAPRLTPDEGGRRHRRRFGELPDLLRVCRL